MALRQHLRIIKIIDPVLCLRCEQSSIADVTDNKTGKTKKMFYCSRLDCDNWETGTIDKSQSFRILNPPH